MHWHACIRECTAHSTTSSHAVVYRHVDCNDFEFPFSRGCSFYEVNSQGLITSARDCVEPALKPGSTALYVRSGCLAQT